eukprot:SAG22_NODE_2031_length_3108_cov_5.278166_2_plen_50_part_00
MSRSATKMAMGYLKQNPQDRDRLKPILSGTMKRAKSLKEEIAASDTDAV